MNQMATLQQLENEVAKLEQLEKSECVHGCIVFIDGSVGDPIVYTKNLLKQYLDEIEPYKVEDLSNVLKEFEEDKEYYDNINEYCKKIYGGYIDRDCIMSTNNYDSLMNSYFVRGDYFVNELTDEDTPAKINLIITPSGELLERENDENITANNTTNDTANNTTNKFDDKLKELYEQYSEHLVVYVEYYVS